MSTAEETGQPDHRVFATSLRRSRALLVGATSFGGGIFFLVLAANWAPSTRGRALGPISDVAMLAAVGMGCAAVGLWSIGSSFRTRRVVMSEAGIRSDRKHIPWTDVLDVTVRRKSTFLSFGQASLITISSPTTALTVDVFQLKCPSTEFLAMFEVFADEYGIVVSDGTLP